jgi:hypothetical protein
MALLGEGTITHEVPSHRMMRVSSRLPDQPTAQQSEADTHVTRKSEEDP